MVCLLYVPGLDFWIIFQADKLLALGSDGAHRSLSVWLPQKGMPLPDYVFFYQYTIELGDK